MPLARIENTGRELVSERFRIKLTNPILKKS
jgi:hypothetical protein